MKNIDGFLDSFREIQPKFSRLYSRVLNQARLTQPQYALLLELLDASPSPMSMTCVSRKLFITKPAVTGLVDRLEKNKYLKRVEHPKDRRVFLLQIQPSGKKVVERMRERFLKVILDGAKNLSDSERATVQKFYSVLSSNLDEILSDGASCR